MGAYRQYLAHLVRRALGHLAGLRQDVPEFAHQAFVDGETNVSGCGSVPGTVSGADTVSGSGGSIGAIGAGGMGSH
ncbi:hypothetical protein GCM10027073_30510 [Streptomyces chlorus]